MSHYKTSDPISRLIKSDKSYTYLQKVIQNILHRRRLSFRDFSQLLYQTCDYTNDISFKQLRNRITNAIFAITKQLSYPVFEFLVTKVLNEPDILNDTEVQFLKRLGPGGLDIRGHRFGSLVAIDLVDSPVSAKIGNKYWLC